MNCLFCEKEINIEEEPFCPDCEEGANLTHAIISATEQWIDCVEQDNTYWRRALIHIQNEIRSIDKTLPLDEQARQLNTMITNSISAVLSFYHKDDIITGSLVIKETARRSILQKDEPSLWFWVNEIEVACIIQQIVSSMKDDDFIGNSLGEKDSGYYGFITAVVLARIQVMLRDNTERYQYKHFEADLMDFAIKLFEDQQLKDYFDRLHDMGPEEKPEDLEIVNEQLRRYLESRSLLQEQIYSSLDNDLLELFGFTFEDIKTMVRAFMSKEENFSLPLKLIRKDLFFNKLEIVLPIERVKCILHFFSINTLSEADRIVGEREFELRSLYQTKDFIVFGELDFMQNVDIFEKLVFSGHFLEMYLPEVQVPQALKDSQQKMATLLSYKLAEMLNSAGYLVPVEKVSKHLGGGQVIRAEIGKILAGKTDILRGLGDIDVLAFIPQKSEVILIELKYFKPGRTIKEVVLSDAGKIESKRVVEKALARENAVKDNLDTVLNMFNITGSTKNIRVRSILVTARPNFKAIQEGLGIEYLTWNELERLIKNNEL